MKISVPEGFKQQLEGCPGTCLDIKKLDHLAPEVLKNPINRKDVFGHLKIEAKVLITNVFFPRKIFVLIRFLFKSIILLP